MKKQCTTCKIAKDVSEFYNRTASEQAVRKDGLQSSCKECMKASKKRMRVDPVKRQREYNLRKKSRLANLDKARRQDRHRNLYRSFGIRPNDYKQLFEAQQGVCAICGKPETAILRGKVKNLAVDHCHETGVVRGLLCSRCNIAVGFLRDDVDIAQNLTTYLVCPIQHPITSQSKP